MSDRKIDVYKISNLIEVFENALLWAWYLSAIILTACLWFFQVPQSRLQSFVFAGVMIWYSLLSISITKVKQVKLELRA